MRPKWLNNSYGWTVTADVPGAKAAQVYNVAIREERLAVEAVRRVLPKGDKAVVKVRSKLTKQLFEALRMQPGDVMLGAQEVPSLTPVASLDGGYCCG